MVTPCPQCSQKRYFPYLDMEIYWKLRDELKFQVHLEPNQKLKYLSSDSTHLFSVIKVIPSEVMLQLGRVTSQTRKT